MTPYARLLIHLLAIACSAPPTREREHFAALKERLCQRYGLRDGHEVQHLTQGVERWVHLQRWRIGPYLFHTPLYTTPYRPSSAPHTWLEGPLPRHTHRHAHEATLWLYLLCGEWRLWGQTMTSTYHAAWWRSPLLTLQRWLFALRHLVRIRPCIQCTRWFLSCEGWAVCRGCRRQPNGTRIWQTVLNRETSFVSPLQSKEKHEYHPESL